MLPKTRDSRAVVPRLRDASLASFRACAHCWYFVVVAMVVDVLFFYSFGKSYAWVFERVSAGLGRMNAILEGQLQGLVSSGVDAVSARVGELQVVYREVFQYIALLVVLLYVCWVVFQGVAWWVAHRIVGTVPARDFLRYIARFAWSNLVWLAVFLAIVFGSSFVSFAAFKSPVPLIGQRGINLLIVLFMVVLLYFSAASYSFKARPVRSAFRLGVRGWRSLVPAYVAAWLVIFGIGWILAPALSVHYGLMLLVLVFVLLPMLTVLRVFWIFVCGELN